MAIQHRTRPGHQFWPLLAQHTNRLQAKRRTQRDFKGSDAAGWRLSKLDELALKVSDMETLLENVSAAAYDKAVEVVTDVVRTETRKEDMRMIEDTKKWVLSPERKAPKATREYASHRLDDVLNKFLKTMQTTAARLQEKLLKPEVRQKGKEQVLASRARLVGRAPNHRGTARKWLLSGLAVRSRLDKLDLVAVLKTPE